MPKCQITFYCGGIKATKTWIGRVPPFGILQALGAKLWFCHCWIEVKMCSGDHWRYDVWANEDRDKSSRLGAKKIGKHLHRNLFGFGMWEMPEDIRKIYERELDCPKLGAEHEKCKCVVDAAENYPQKDNYGFAGQAYPNSNSFPEYVAHKCGLRVQRPGCAKGWGYWERGRRFTRWERYQWYVK